jgi:hypothetical protein
VLGIFRREREEKERREKESAEARRILSEAVTFAAVDKFKFDYAPPTAAVQDAGEMTLGEAVLQARDSRMLLTVHLQLPNWLGYGSESWYCFHIHRRSRKACR